MEVAESPRLGAYRLPIDRAWTAIALMVPVVVVLLAPMRSIDLAYHVRAGVEIRSTTMLLRSDTWTFGAPEAVWVDQQWGAQLILSSIHDLGDWAGMMTAWAALTGVAFGFTFAACRARGSTPRWAALLTLAGFLASQSSLAMRPQMLAVPAFAIALWAIATRAPHPRRLWLLPVLAALVANLHGSFVLFPLLAGLVLLEELVARTSASRRAAAVLIATTLATLINPFWASVWTYAYDLATNDTIRNSVVEWQPVTLTSVGGGLIFASLGLVTVMLARRKETVAWVDLIWLGIFFLLGLATQRSTVWWGLVFPVVVAGWAREQGHGSMARKPARRGSPMPANVIMATLVLAAIALLPWWRGAGERELLADVPFGVSERVAGLPEGSRVLVNQPWGSWFEFATPHIEVFVDSRIELFDEDTWDDYDEVAFAGALWQEVLEERDPDAIVAAADWELVPLLREDPDWHLEYEDEDGLLFVRS